MKRSHVVLVVVMAVALSVFAYSVRAQSDGGSIPSRTRNIRSFCVSLGQRQSADVFTVPDGRTFLVTDIVLGRANGTVLLFEGGAAGPLRGAFQAIVAGSIGAGSGCYSLRSGIPYGPGTIVTVFSEGPDPMQVTIAGFLIET